MKREIKFRAWDKDRKVMRSALGIDPRSKKIIAFLLPDEGGGQKEYENCELMQYTGLKDKNEKEIYEGDIVRSKETNTILTVRWDEAYCITGFTITNDMAKVIEIIGNIYENPDLLK